MNIPIPSPIVRTLSGPRRKLIVLSLQFPKVQPTLCLVVSINMTGTPPAPVAFCTSLVSLKLPTLGTRILRTVTVNLRRSSSDSVLLVDRVPHMTWLLCPTSVLRVSRPLGRLLMTSSPVPTLPSSTGHALV